MDLCAKTRIPLNVSVGSRHREFLRFCRDLESAFRRLDTIGEKIPQLRQHACAYQVRPSIDELRLMLACNIVLDLVMHGWGLTVNHRTAYLTPPAADEQSPEQKKEAIRQRHLIERDAQLREPSVREFIRGMESRRLRGKIGWHSIYSVMRDGEELAASLRRAASYTSLEERQRELESVIDPYVQFVTPGAVCMETGLKLQDIWRYFRHTWVNAYRSVPGRSMMILIRDRARPYHPVIGLAALSNSVVQQSIRDKWIGWDSDVAVAEMRHSLDRQFIHVLLDELESLISGIYTADLVRAKLLRRRDLRNPSDKVIASLKKAAERAIKLHRQNPDVEVHKAARIQSARELAALAKTNLFRSKRSRQLAALLEIRQIFQRKKVVRGMRRKQIQKVLSEPAVLNALRRLIRFTKAEKVGISMMDITVCGAVAPYNAILGGKLVCLLVCSPEVVAEYSRRYKGYASIIASGMKAARVTRRPQLVLLCTTSLYGNGSSQYNRIKVPAEVIGGRPDELLAFEELGTSEGFGSFHFSKESVRLADALLGRSNHGRKVNSIFGEGVNPLMRKMRESLSVVGLSTELLRHGNKRIVYGIGLASNFRRFLLGRDKRIRYLIPSDHPERGTSLLSGFWVRRWLAKRIENLEIIQRVKEHSLAYPIRHGAKVQLPSEEVPDLIRALSASAD
jgi:hypothetical protein